MLTHTGRKPNQSPAKAGLFSLEEINMQKAVLPYPLGINMQVFQDDGNWGNYRAWFLRTHEQLQRLFVAKITLGHYEGTGDPAYSYREWIAKSQQIVDAYPQCVFVYGSNGEA